MYRRILLHPRLPRRIPNSPILFALLLVGPFLADVAAAQCGVFQVNSYTTNRQYLATPVANPVTDEILVVWQSRGSTGADPFDYSVQGRLFDLEGAAQGTEFVINTGTAHQQRRPAAAVDPSSGNFVVVWESNEDAANAGANPFLIRARVLNGDGVPLSGEIDVDPTRGESPEVGYQPSGDFVVLWFEKDGSFETIVGHRFGSAGAPLGSRFAVTPASSEARLAFASAVDGDSGDFWVTWDEESVADEGRILVQKMSSTGTLLGGELQVATVSGGLARFPAIAHDSTRDQFVVAWTSDPDGSAGAMPAQIHAQRVDESGGLLGAELQVTSTPSGLGSNRNPGIAIDPDSGDIWIGWQDEHPSPDLFGYRGHLRRFSSTGVAQGEELPIQPNPNRLISALALTLVPSPTAGSQWDPFVTWGRIDPGASLDNDDVLANFVTRTLESGCPLLEDGFESGNTMGWVTRVP